MRHWIISDGLVLDAVVVDDVVYHAVNFPPMPPSRFPDFAIHAHYRH